MILCLHSNLLCGLPWPGNVHTETAVCYVKFNLFPVTMSFPGFLIPYPFWTFYGVLSSLAVLITPFYQRQYVVIICTYKMVIGPEPGHKEIMLKCHFLKMF